SAKRLHNSLVNVISANIELGSLKNVNKSDLRESRDATEVFLKYVRQTQAALWADLAKIQAEGGVENVNMIEKLLSNPKLAKAITDLITKTVKALAKLESEQRKEAARLFKEATILPDWDAIPKK